MPMTNSKRLEFFQQSTDQQALLTKSGAADHDFELLLSTIPGLNFFDAQETVDDYAKPLTSLMRLMLKMANAKENGTANREDLLADLFTCSDEWDTATAQLEASLVTEDEEYTV